MENKNKKRYYKVGEIVWVVGKKEEGKVAKIDKESLEVVVELNNGDSLLLKMWEIDKLKFKRAEELAKKKAKAKLPKVYFAKVRPSAIIPTKRDEDAGYDIYANVEPKLIDGEEVYEIYLPKGKATLVPTGIAVAMPETHYLNTKKERGSTGKIGMSVLSGVIDSGYRGEIFLALIPLHKNILITSKVNEVQEYDDSYLYPYSKAIAQGAIELVPKVNIEEISYDDLKKIKSKRGDTKLGESGK